MLMIVVIYMNKMTTSEFQDDDLIANSLETPIPESLGSPIAYYVWVMPISPKPVSTGGIILPDETIDMEWWNAGIGRLARKGPCAWKHPRFEDMGMTADMEPQIGDIVIFGSRTPNRFKYQGARIVRLTDAQIDGIEFHHGD